MADEQKVGTTEARAELQRGLQAFRSFEFADKALARIEGLEQNERELNERVKRLQSDADAAEKDSKERIGRAEAEAKEVEARAAAARDGAKKAGDEIIARAKEQAAGIVESANAKAQATSAKVDQARADKVQIEQELGKSRKDLADLERRIAEARQTIQSMLKGT